MKNIALIKSAVLLFILSASTATAQDITQVARKSLFTPFFLRVGMMSGMSTSRLGDVGTIGLRAEYGLSAKFSLVGDAQASKGTSAISGGQGSVAMRYQPLILGRFQPYVGAGFGVGSVSGEGRMHCGHPPVPTVTAVTSTTDTTPIVAPTTHHHLGGIGVVQFGANFRVSSHFVASAEGAYQKQMSRHGDPGLTGFRMGMAYQFGR